MGLFCFAFNNVYLFGVGEVFGTGLTGWYSTRFLLRWPKWTHWRYRFIHCVLLALSRCQYCVAWLCLFMFIHFSSIIFFNSA